MPAATNLASEISQCRGREISLAVGNKIVSSIYSTRQAGKRTGKNQKNSQPEKFALSCRGKATTLQLSVARVCHLPDFDIS